MIGVGIALAILASVCTNFGNNLQKWAFNNMESETYYKNKYWIIGFILSIIASVLDLIALANAAQSIIGPLAVCGLISNLFFSHYWLNETINRRNIISTFIIVCGIILVVIFGNHSVRDYTIEDFIGYMYNTSSILYIVFIVIICSFLHVKSRFILNIRYKIDESPNDLINEEFMVGRKNSLIRTYNEYKGIFPYYLSILSGILGGNSILFGKMSAEIVSASPIKIFSLVGITCIILLLTTVITQQHYLAMSLKYFDVSIVIPIFSCSFILTTIISGGCYFQEFSQLSILSICLFCLGVSIIIIGIMIGKNNVEYEEISINSTLELIKFEDYDVLDV